MVDHFYWKMEYQACGAPYYHVLLIKHAPVMSQDDPDEVLGWIVQLGHQVSDAQV